MRELRQRRRFEVVARLRPVDLVAPGAVAVETAFDGQAPAAVSAATPQPAPYAAVVADLRCGATGRLTLELTADDGVAMRGTYDGTTVSLSVRDAQGRSTRHRSRRHARPDGPLRSLALTLTGDHLTAFGHDGWVWTAHGRVRLAPRVDTRSEPWSAGLRSGYRWQGPGPAGVDRLTAGGFGQLGLRDVRLVTEADGTPVRDGGSLLLTATHAGPGFFDTGHTGVWSLDAAAMRLRHRADLFFRRPSGAGVYGDHATHLVRAGGRWLVATSTWGDFDRARPGASVAVTLAETDADVTSGRHVLDTRALPLPTTAPGLDLRSVGVWDPHLVRVGGAWQVGFVSARRFFSFHPALAAGPTLDRLTLRAAAADRTHTEGTTLVRLDEGWRMLASDGRDNPRGRRARFPVFDLDLREVGELDAPYQTNIPWPTLVRLDQDWLMVAFDGTAYGGPLLGYGSHGSLVVLRTGGRGDRGG